MSSSTSAASAAARATPEEKGFEKTSARSTGLLIYFTLGVYLGVVFTKSEVISWFRIQEMFRFQSFHMYGIIGSALVVASISIALIKKYDIKNVSGEPIVIPPKKTGSRNWRYWIGGTMFGLGWALTGACPGPIFALIGNGIWVMAVTLISAVAGTWVYGYLRPKLPHY